MKFKCNNLLVTGGAGFIGSNFINFILKKYKFVRIYNLDLLTYAGNLENTNEFASNPRYKFIQGDICDEVLLEKIFNNYKIDGVINFAAESHVDNSINYPEKFINTNINGTFKLLNMCLKKWMIKPFKYIPEFQECRFHQVSTDEVYGSINTGSFTESHPYNPNSPYSASKAAADMIVRSFNKTYGLNTTISVSSNNFGPNQNIEKFIPKILNCLINNKEVPVYSKGENIRDWIYVYDNCSAIDLIFNQGNSGNKYNIGSNNEISNIDLVKNIFKFFNLPIKINFVKDRYGHDFRYSVNTNKIKIQLGWKPKRDLNYFLESIKLKFKNE